MTKADVLDNFDELQVCTAYNVEGKETVEIPYQMMRLNIKPVYKSFAGWKTDSSVIKSAVKLPATMQQYVGFINQYLGVEVHYISNGPGREQIISLTWEKGINPHKK